MLLITDIKVVNDLEILKNNRTLWLEKALVVAWMICEKYFMK